MISARTKAALAAAKANGKQLGNYHQRQPTRSRSVDRAARGPRLLGCYIHLSELRSPFFRRLGGRAVWRADRTKRPCQSVRT
jgi:hypothetical protein